MVPSAGDTYSIVWSKQYITNISIAEGCNILKYNPINVTLLLTVVVRFPAVACLNDAIEVQLIMSTQHQWEWDKSNLTSSTIVNFLPLLLEHRHHFRLRILSLVTTFGIQRCAVKRGDVAASSLSSGSFQTFCVTEHECYELYKTQRSTTLHRDSYHKSQSSYPKGIRLMIYDN
ncbi:hypothetical protein AGLY_016104, partial [Aphis glycines]